MRALLIMSLLFYKSIHLLGIAALFVSIGASMQAATLGKAKEDNPWSKSNAIIHGVALLLLLVSGFGMHAKLGISGFPVWLVIKLIVWAFFGYAISFAKKGPDFVGTMRWVTIGIFALAIFLSLYKPF